MSKLMPEGDDATVGPAEAAALEAVPLADGEGYARRLRNSLIALLAVAGAVALLLISLPGLDEVSTEVSSAGAGWLALAVAFEYLSCVGYVLTILLVFYRGPLRATVRLAWSELAANSVLPAGGLGGLGLGAWVLRYKGVPAARITERSTVVFLITSVPTIGALVIVGLGLGLGLFSGPRDALLTYVPAAVGVLVVALTFLAAGLAGRIAARTSRARVRDGLTWVVQGVDGTIAATRSRDWRLIGPLAYFWLDVLTLWAAFAAIGDTPPLAVITMAHLFGQLAGALPIPGGLGAVDGGLVGALVLYGVGLAPAAAAVLLYRAISLGLPALLGTIAFLLLRRRLDEPLVLGPIRPEDERRWET